MYEPWLCRALHKLKARVIGIDHGQSQGEEFEFHYDSLLREEALSFIEDSSVDLACAFRLFDSPSNYSEGNILFNKLLVNLERKLKPKGMFIFDSSGTDYSDEFNWKKFLESRSSNL